MKKKYMKSKIIEKIKSSIIAIGVVIFILVFCGGVFYIIWKQYKWNNLSYSPEINTVLFMAGDNRPQLEKVLKHYKRNPADSLKLRAAEFLIINMPGKYSLEYEIPFEYVVAAYMRWDEHEDPKKVNRIFGFDKQTVKEDVKYITADYLIDNIELAFRMWKEQPWGKNVPFDVFCEEILPYRVANEPLEYWREKVLASFSKINKSFKEQPDITAVEACIKVNSSLPRLRLMARMPEMNYSMIMTTTRGMCDEMSALAVFAMRALGIPVAQECTLKWVHRNVGHMWNSVYDSAGRRFSFMGTEAVPGVSHHGSRMPKSKVYRITFARQNNIDIDNASIPPPLRNQHPNLKDVTDEYVEAYSVHPGRKDTAANILPIRKKGIIDDFLYKRGLGIVLDPLCEKGGSVDIPVRYPLANNTGYAWLAAIGDNMWNISGWGKIVDSVIHFGTIGRNILYLPLHYKNGIAIAANYPFIVNSDDSVRIFEPDTINLWPLSISEISPSNDNYKDRMINGIFEGANQSDFSDAQTLYSVRNASGMYFNTAKIRNISRFRYVRYVSPEKSHCHVAEIMFYNDKGEKLSGRPIGMPGSYQNSSMTFDKAFDGDISTFYDALLYSDSWMGLELDAPQTIATIQYLPRNDGCGIYDGHIYELYYWKNTGWQSIEQQTAVNHSLFFNEPVNALLYLKNLTTGKSGQWFVTNKNGEIEWL
jgi:hypothetical protein